MAWFLYPLLLKLVVIGARDTTMASMFYNESTGTITLQIIHWYFMKKDITYPWYCLFLWDRSRHSATVSPSRWSSSFQTHHTPFIFVVTPSKLSKENAHFLCAEQLCLIAPQHITIQKRKKKPPLRLTHGQWKHIKPHENTSSANSPLEMLFDIYKEHSTICHPCIIWVLTSHTWKINTQLQNSSHFCSRT